MPSAPTASTLSAPAGTGAAPGSSLLPSLGAAQAPGAAQPGEVQTNDAFLQLFAGMIKGTPVTTTTAVPTTPQDLANLPFECDADALLESLEPGETADKDTDDTDADGDEAGALAVAALLTGLATTPVAVNVTASQVSADGARLELASLSTARLAAEMSDAVVDDLTDDTADAAGNTPLATTDSSAQAAPQSTSTTPTQMHALLNSHAAAAADAAPDVIVQSPVGTPEWKEEVGNQITWMAVNGREAASLRLSPEHLGPVEVRISVDDGKASVYFGAANADTRSALEQSLPRLRELFATQGLVLADANVSRDAPRYQFKPPASPGTARGSSDAAAEASVTSVTLARSGLIDTYV